MFLSISLDISKVAWAFKLIVAEAILPKFSSLLESLNSMIDNKIFSRKVIPNIQTKIITVCHFSNEMVFHGESSWLSSQLITRGFFLETMIILWCTVEVLPTSCHMLLKLFLLGCLFKITCGSNLYFLHWI